MNGLFIVLTLNSLRSATINIHSHNVSITKREDARRRRHNRSAPHHGRVSRLDQPAERCFESARNCRESRYTERYIELFFHSSILWDGDPPAIPPSSQLSFPISFHPTYISLFSLPSPQLHATNHPPFLTVTIRLQPIGSAPHLTQRIFKLGTNSTFATIVRFLRRRLGVKEHESVFCYVGSVFSPGLDEGVGNLWSCFRQGEELVVGYAISPAFG